LYNTDTRVGQPRRSMTEKGEGGSRSILISFHMHSVRSKKCIQPPPYIKWHAEASLQGTAAVMLRLDVKGGGKVGPP
jgi:hypothetical protein